MMVAHGGDELYSLLLSRVDGNVKGLEASSWHWTPCGVIGLRGAVDSAFGEGTAFHKTNPAKGAVRVGFELVLLTENRQLIDSALLQML